MSARWEVFARLAAGHRVSLDDYRADGGFQGLQAALSMGPAATVEAVRASGLTGRSGGTAFPTGDKWLTVPEGSHPRFVVVNGDESEPGLAKDRALMERDPYSVVEGALITAAAVGAAFVVIYVRGEMAAAFEAITAAVNDAYALGWAGRHIGGTDRSIDVVAHAGAGAYVVGEETALLESLEGQRGMPRIRPPHPTVSGLYGMPTVVNNVETVATLPWILRHGPDAFAAMGGGRSRGTRLFSVSGDVQSPGVFEVELHRTTFRDLIFDIAGGLRLGRQLKAFLTGASFPWLFEDQLDVSLDVDAVAAHGAPLAPGIIVIDDRRCAVRLAWRLVRFYARESCGKCTPCREGTDWLEKVMARIETGTGRPDDLALLDSIGASISPPPFPRPAWPSRGLDAVPFPYRQTTICALGPAAVAPVASSLTRFRDEYERHIAGDSCQAA